MFNIDQEVYVKGIITGVSKEKDGSFEYTVQIQDEHWHDTEVTVKEDQVKLGPLSVEDLEKRCE